MPAQRKFAGDCKRQSIAKGAISSKISIFLCIDLYVIAHVCKLLNIFFIKLYSVGQESLTHLNFNLLSVTDGICRCQFSA